MLFWTNSGINTPQNSYCTSRQLTSHLKTSQLRRIRHTGHSWRWAPSHGPTNVGRPARTYLHQLCADTECSLKDLPGEMDDIDWWRERERVRNLCFQCDLILYIYIMCACVWRKIKKQSNPNWRIQYQRKSTL